MDHAGETEYSIGRFFSAEGPAMHYNGRRCRQVYVRVLYYPLRLSFYGSYAPVVLTALVYGDIVLLNCLTQPVFVKSYPLGQEYWHTPC